MYFGERLQMNGDIIILALYPCLSSYFLGIHVLCNLLPELRDAFLISHQEISDPIRIPVYFILDTVAEIEKLRYKIKFYLGVLWRIFANCRYSQILLPHCKSLVQGFFFTKIFFGHGLSYDNLIRSIQCRRYVAFNKLEGKYLKKCRISKQYPWFIKHFVICSDHVVTKKSPRIILHCRKNPFKLRSHSCSRSRRCVDCA